MNIVEFFDPYNIEHIRAYRHLQEQGMWPVGFIPENVKKSPVPSGWTILMVNKIADAWIDHMPL
jgi:hypothetical protein